MLHVPKNFPISYYIIFPETTVITTYCRTSKSLSQAIILIETGPFTQFHPKSPYKLAAGLCACPLFLSTGN